MAKVFKLAYADFASKDVSKLADYYTRTMGYALAHRGEDGSAYMSNGFDHHYIVITPSDIAGFGFTGTN
ncbi:catechol-2,3-dioxygenase [Paenibacillus sp. V4I9]|uniref:hypothetical protein n=1 Tax=Paenibacillus sp. V4I9 TaxID=3042308 RepID=UPI00278370D0|nr:hypothetical protein [Paenibacillus sp. V4I9]MDQ0889767.1 catechol-2,3-dioxygenase [Paenibacillus sp. V4I9]